MPAPLVNVEVGPYVVDALWPDAGLVVEIDSRRHHHTRAAFERDRRRDADLMLRGLRVLRVTDERLDREPDAVMATIVALRRQPPASRTPWR